MDIISRIGFMQGRLSEIVDNKIQAFPWNSWQEEFINANSLKFNLMEWTLDHENLTKNPLVDRSKHTLIQKLCTENNIRITSLTGDCFMQFPFWKYQGERQKILKKQFDIILNSCAAFGIKIIVIPLVDNGKIENFNQEKELRNFLVSRNNLLTEFKIQIGFESDFSPNKLLDFIQSFPSKNFGINYDMGNSASMGFDPIKEINTYGERIINVHVKDRIKKGPTIPLGEGDVKFIEVFKMLSKSAYKGNFIIQGARDINNDHIGILNTYKKFVSKLIKEYF